MEAGKKGLYKLYQQAKQKQEYSRQELATIENALANVEAFA